MSEKKKPSKKKSFDFEALRWSLLYITLTVLAIQGCYFQSRISAHEERLDMHFSVIAETVQAVSNLIRMGPLR